MDLGRDTGGSSHRVSSCHHSLVFEWWIFILSDIPSFQPNVRQTSAGPIINEGPNVRQTSAGPTFFYAFLLGPVGGANHQFHEMAAVTMPAKMLTYRFFVLRA